MGKKIVGAISSYVGLQPFPQDWLWHQTPYPFGQWGNIRIDPLAAEPDLMLMYQFDFPKPPPPESLRSRLRRVVRGQQPPQPPPPVESLLRGVPKQRTVYLLREPPLEEVVEKHKAAYGEARQYCGYISGPDRFAPQPDYMPAIWYVAQSFRELNEMPPPPKQKSCSWITSGIARTANHRQRLDFLHLLRSRQLNFDLYGRDLPDWSQPRGTLKNKWHGMASYYYNLSIENYADNDLYVSEKLWDALLCWCLPIYYGGPAADKLLPSGSFLRLPSLDERGLSYIQEVIASPDAWHEAQGAIAEARKIILHKLNLLNWLSEFSTRLD
jgi:hypothetical protein